MVSRALPPFLILFAITAVTHSATQGPGDSPAWPDYKIGDMAKEDIITPVALEVIDQEATEALKQKEASRVPVICRFYTNALPESEFLLHRAIEISRSNFLRAVSASFPDMPLTASDVNAGEFQQLLAAFQKRHRGFPVSTNLAQLWAQGNPDDELEASLTRSLRRAMASPVRPPNIPATVRFGSTVRLVPVADWSNEPTLEMSGKLGFNISRSNIITSGRVKEALLAEYPSEDLPLAKFLVSLVRTNCVPDERLTLQARAERTEGMLAADHYEVAQVIAHRGQIIDKKVKAALEQLREKTAISALQQQLRYNQLEAGESSRRLHWLLAGLGLLLAILLLIVWRLSGRRQVVSLVPAQIPPGDAGYYQRALPAPRSGSLPALASDGAQAGDLRERLLPHLARLMMNKFLGRLLSQRTELLDAQTRAAADIAALERRLESIHAPLQDRLKAYEERISELQKELAQKGEENRELIRATIELARKQMSATRERLDLN